MEVRRGAVGSSPGSYPGGQGFKSPRRNQFVFGLDRGQVVGGLSCKSECHGEPLQSWAE